MDKITVEVKGIPEAIAKLRGYQLTKRLAIQQALAETAHKIETQAKILVPVDTSRLKNSIASDLTMLFTKLSARVGTDVEYAAYVEFGTEKMAARSFLFPAYFSYESECVKDIIKILNKPT